jgi:hypothetical protein
VIWEKSHRADPFAVDIADRHYSRQKPGTPQFMPTGGCVVYRASTPTGRAVWGTSTPFAEWVKHAWAGAWVCSIFRNEGAGVASEMIKEAVSASRYDIGLPPALGMVTFINRKCVRPFVTPKGREIYGQSFRQAGFVEVGETKGGLLALQMWPDAMPEPAPARNVHLKLFA